MWLCLNDLFLSFVSKDCAEDELMVRARRPGDIEKLFPDAKVTRYTKSDYLFRAPVKKDAVKAALVAEVDRIVYSNFKASVRDNDLHNAYNRVWSVMAELQPTKPYSGIGMPSKGLDSDWWRDRDDLDLPLPGFDSSPAHSGIAKKNKKKAKKK